MSQLFGMDRTVVVRHISNIYKDEELQEETTCAKMHRFKTKAVEW